MKFTEILKENPALLREIRQGVEKECLRLDLSGRASTEPHHEKLGSKLTHSKITTDYAENLLEFITPVHKSSKGLLEELKLLHAYTLSVYKNEILSSGSMPGILGQDKDIPIANYGKSNIGKLKTLYRRGLGFRYGRSMQSIAGVHYNFSFSDKFWEALQKQSEDGQKLELKEFKNDAYFSLIRNYRRYSWVLIYLYGASSVVDESFLDGKEHSLEKINDSTYGSRYGTSLRMGGLGYTSSAQEKISICFNKVETYIETLELARLESVPEYEDIGVCVDGEFRQLNSNLLQIDNEFYSTIRPKNVAHSGESALQALNNRGVEYIEVRLLDLNPFTPLGIDETQMLFLQSFLTWCLLKDSPLIEDGECSEVQRNFDLIVKEGRSPDLFLYKNGEKVSRESFLKEIFSEISDVATLISEDAISAVSRESLKIEELDLLPSEKLYKMAQKENLRDIYINLGKTYRDSFAIKDDERLKLEELAVASLNDQAEIESLDKLSFEDFLESYFQEIKISF